MGAFLYLVSSWLLLPLMVRLMAKKRDAQEADEQQYNRSSKRREDIGASSSAGVATQARRLRPCSGPSTSQAGSSTTRGRGVEAPQAINLGRFAERKITLEKYVEKDLFVDTQELKWLAKIGWNPIFKPNNNADAETVGHFYTSIQNPNLQSMTFDVAISNSLITFKVSDIERISGVPCVTVIVPYKDAKRSRYRDERIVFVCGELKLWVTGDNCLELAKMLPVYRFLHLVFMYNLYPRSGNKTQVT